MRSDDRSARVMRGPTDVFAMAAFAVRLSSPRLRVCPAYRARPLALFLAGVLGRAASVARTVTRALLSGESRIGMPGGLALKNERTSDQRLGPLRPLLLTRQYSVWDAGRLRGGV